MKQNNMRRIFFYMICMALMAVSCKEGVIKEPSITGYRIAEISDVTMGKGVASATVRIDVDIDNPSRLSYAIDNLTATVYNESSVRFADAVLREPVRAAADSTETIPVYLNVKFQKPLTILASGILNGKSFDMEGYTADIDTQIGVGKISRHIKKDGIPIAEVIKAIETAKSITEKFK